MQKKALDFVWDLSKQLTIFAGILIAVAIAILPHIGSGDHYNLIALIVFILIVSGLFGLLLMTRMTSLLAKGETYPLLDGRLRGRLQYYLVLQVLSLAVGIAVTVLTVLAQNQSST